MQIKKIEVDWYEGYMNSPALKVSVDEIYNWDEFLYEVHPHGEHDILLSTNKFPWCRFVSVDRQYRDGSPIQGGALGGTYQLTDGTEYKTRTGWSSRAGAINKYFEMSLMDVTVRTESGGNWAGFALDAHATVNYLPENVWLVKNEKFSREPYWTPSTESGRIVKPNGQVID